MNASGSGADVPSGASSDVPRLPVRVLLADDQRLVRESVGTLLGLLDGIELVATAADGEQALALCAEHRPQIVLMDLRMPRLDGIQATGRLREEQPEVCVIALTTYADDDSVLGALRAGARGYLTKDASGEDIRNAILTVAGGDAALDPAVQHHVVAALAGDPAAASAGSGSDAAAEPELPDDLTPREAQVLALIAAGLTNAEIAERLVVSPTTVKSHINHLFAKAGLRDRAQAVGYAYRTGIAQPPG
jgi:DNA-binding NarL/FixJ family response regulator